MIWYYLLQNRAQIARTAVAVAVVVVLGLGLLSTLGDGDGSSRTEKCTEFEGYAWAGDSCAARKRAACRDAEDTLGVKPSQC